MYAYLSFNSDLMSLPIIFKMIFYTFITLKSEFEEFYGIPGAYIYFK